MSRFSNMNNINKNIGNMHNSNNTTKTNIVSVTILPNSIDYVSSTLKLETLSYLSPKVFENSRIKHLNIHEKNININNHYQANYFSP